MTGSTLDIRDVGAKNDHLVTGEIQKAIDLMGRQGGGVVMIPDGRWISGTLNLRSGVTLHVNPGAVLKASSDIEHFPRRSVALPEAPHEAAAFSQKNARERRHFIVAENAEHVTITGGGTIDGSGPDFWLGPRDRAPWITAKPDRVTPMFEFERCRYLRLDDFRILDSPGWTVHPLNCDHVTIRGLTIENNLLGPNTDGIDVNGCRDVFISDCRLTCGDDAIILKATWFARSTERVVISNCVVTSNCIGIGLGQETESDIRQIAVSNCVARHCHRLFTIGSWAGGTVEDVVVTGLVGDTLKTFPLARPLQLEAKQHVGWDVPLGKIRNVQIANVMARTEGRCLFTAQDGSMLENVVLRDLNLCYTGLEDPEKLSPERGDQGSTQYANRNLEARKQPAAVVVENARNFVMDGLYVNWPEQAGDLPPHRALWAHHLEGGRIHVPLATASVPGLDPVVTKGSRLDM